MRLGVALLEDNEAFRMRLVRRLEFFPQVEVLFHAAAPDEFFRCLARLERPPDVALLDIGLGEASGIDVVASLAESHPEVGVLMLTVFENPEVIMQAIRAGAAGYLLKDASAEELVRALQEVQAGGVPLSRPVARQVLRLIGSPARVSTESAAAAPASSDLSPREIDLLEEIVRGDTEAEIADRLCISPHTVRTHVKNIYRKLQVHSRAAAVRAAYERRLLPPSTDGPGEDVG